VAAIERRDIALRMEHRLAVAAPPRFVHLGRAYGQEAPPVPQFLVPFGSGQHANRGLPCDRRVNIDSKETCTTLRLQLAAAPVRLRARSNPDLGTTLHHCARQSSHCIAALGQRRPAMQTTGQGRALSVGCTPWQERLRPSARIGRMSLILDTRAVSPRRRPWALLPNPHSRR
jgi:hypothetical protein